jgi:hypothetical protein
VTQAAALQPEPLDSRTELPGSRTWPPRFGIRIGDTDPVAAAPLGQVQRLVRHFHQVVEVSTDPWDERGTSA